MYVGVDGFRHGWVSVSIDGQGNGSIEFLCEISQLNHRQYHMAMIDIPIGLPQSGNRDCDMAARKYLGRNRNRVFTGARRPLLKHCHSYDEANRLGRKLLVDGNPGAGISKQLFCILKKIKEVDVFLNPQRQEKLRECHPELVFHRQNNDHPVDNKHVPQGRSQRRKLLGSIRNLDDLLAARLGTGAKEDDVLDACACAVAAMDCANDKGNVVPDGRPPMDRQNLVMQIWY